MMRAIRGVLTGAFVLAAASVASAQTATTWPGPETNLYVGNLDYWWASQVARAANEWNKKTDFTFKIRGEGFPACDRYDSGVLLRPDEQRLLNGVEFGDDMCFFVDFDSNTLAVVVSIVDPVNGLLTKGMIFNEFWNWDVYSGPVGGTTIDFHRVAVHELGHFLGLGHNEVGESIMFPAIQDDVEDITEADIAAANLLYAAAPPPEEEPVDPLVACQVSQLKATSRLCKAELLCEGKHGADDAKRDACVGSAESAFVAAWDAAVAAGAANGGCHSQAAGQDVTPLVGAATAGAIGLVGEADASNADDVALRTKLMKKAGGLCTAAVGAWKKNAAKDNPTKLATNLARARAAFASAASKAVANARARGVSYDGANEQLIADELETLANDVGAMTGAH
jgi:hypothetical protein